MAGFIIGFTAFFFFMWLFNRIAAKRKEKKDGEFNKLFWESELKLMLHRDETNSRMRMEREMFKQQLDDEMSFLEYDVYANYRDYYPKK